MKLIRVIIALLLALSPLAASATVTVQNLRIWRAPDHTRLVFDLSAPLKHQLFTLKNPDRIVIDMQDAVLRGELPLLSGEGSFVRGLRHGRPDPGTLRVVLDLRQMVKPRTFVLTPNDRYGHRLVIDLYAADAESKPHVVSRPEPSTARYLTIAVDAGHGGEDFGAVGRHKTREKDVVLSIARYLKKYIDGDPAMRGVMVRDGDYYISLYERTALARKRGADLFVSIHADYFPKSSISGASVYALSQRGATSSQAKILADKENAADLFGGVSISDKDDLLAKVLLDLSMTQTISDSLEFGVAVLGSLRTAGPIHIPRVEQAGFAVLKSPDMPSILVETAFISNNADEQRLSQSKTQREIARAIYEGIRRYAARGKIKKIQVVKAREHLVQRGDTLSEIALRYNVSVDALRTANGISGHVVRIGQKLRIPADSHGG